MQEVKGPDRQQLLAWISESWKDQEYRQWIVDHSFRNCHVVSVTSVNFGNFGEFGVRMFIALPGHPLQYNLPDFYRNGLTVAFHPHRRNIRLLSQIGVVTNWNIEESREGPFSFDRYLFSSAIKGDDSASFALEIENCSFRTESIKELSRDDSIYLDSRMLHTTGVKEGELSAWFVIGDKYDKNYRPISFSNVNLSSFTSSGLYLRPDVEGLHAELKLAEVL